MKNEILGILGRIERPQQVPTKSDVEKCEEFVDYLYSSKDEYLLSNSEVYKNYLRNIINEIVIREKHFMENIQNNYSDEFREFMITVENMKDFALITLAKFFPDFLNDDNFKKQFSQLPIYVRNT